MLISFFGTMKLKLTVLGGLSSSWEEPVHVTKKYEHEDEQHNFESKYTILFIQLISTKISDKNLVKFGFCNSKLF